GRVVVVPAVRSFRGRGWSGLSARPLLCGPATPAEALHEVLAPFRGDLASVPLYLSVDKDVLTAADAAVNWDSGHLRLADALAVLEVVLGAGGGRLAGADVLGDWSPVGSLSPLARVCHVVDHPSPAHDPVDATHRNMTANAALLAVLARGV